MSREALAVFLARSTNAVSTYTTEGRGFAVQDAGFRRAHEDIVDAEFDAVACTSASGAGWWVAGAVHFDSEVS
ncbi:MAG: hypothetical protein ACE37F_14255 [Nannocystaceae bacterium]|nr:hypothetical protein [bacterium]